VPYIIRNTSTELWQAFRARAAQEGRSLRWLLEEFIRRYVENGLE
jgi:plasmid stability protein